MVEHPRLLVSPGVALVDAPLDLRVSGCRPRATVAIRACVEDALRGRWRSEAAWATDADGAADLGSAPPRSGGFAIADPFGLLWSLEREPTAPPVAGFAVPSEPFDVQLTLEVDGAVADRARIRRSFMGSGVIREPVRDLGLIGTLFSLASAAPRPGVLVVGGSDGGLSEGMAALLASHGFAVLALAYFRAEHLPAALVEIPLEYFEAALGWLRQRADVGPRGLGVVGRSRGGELALLLGATFPEIGAVVGYVPSGVVHAGISASPVADGAARSAWRYRGQPLPFVPPPGVTAAAASSPSSSEARLELTPMFMKSLEDRAAVDAAAIPVERIRGPVLLISGEDDRLWPSPLLAEIAVARLAAHRHAHPVAHLRYPGAGHMIGPVGLPATANVILHPLRQRSMALGGTPAGNASASAHSWPRVLAFLRASLAPG
jgi:dienelactone hydrolase